MGNKVCIFKNIHGDPFVFQKDKEYFIYNNPKPFKGDKKLLLEAIKNAQNCDFPQEIERHRKDETMKEYWQTTFNYMYTRGVGVYASTDPEDEWKDELTRRGLLHCKECGTLMIMHFNRFCPLCTNPPYDKQMKAYDLTFVCSHIAAKHKLKPNCIEELLFERNHNIFNFITPEDNDDSRWIRELCFIDAIKTKEIKKLGFTEQEIKLMGTYISWINELLPIKENRFFTDYG